MELLRPCGAANPALNAAQQLTRDVTSTPFVPREFRGLGRFLVVERQGVGIK